jgi:hypothetical protein
MSKKYIVKFQSLYFELPQPIFGYFMGALVSSFHCYIFFLFSFDNFLIFFVFFLWDPKIGNNISDDKYLHISSRYSLYLSL